MKKIDTNSIIRMTNSKIAFDSYIKDETKRTKRNRTFGIIACLIITLTSISGVYAEEIKETVSNVISKYISKEDQTNLLEYGVNEDANGVQIVQVTEKVTINKLTNTTFNSYEEARKALGVPLLTVPDELTQFRIFYVGDDPWLTETNLKPRIVHIDLSNHMTYNCEREEAYNENSTRCQEEHKELNKTNHYLDINIRFLTQYAKEEDKEEFMAILGDFPSRKTSSYESKKQKTTVYTEGNIKYVFVKDNIIYTLNNYANYYTEEQMKNIIENMN